MSPFVEHLNTLTVSSENNASDLRVAEEWTKVSAADGASSSEDWAQVDSDSSWSSVVDAFRASTSKQHGLSPILSKLVSQPSIARILPSLHQFLSSNRPNEAISEELAEMLGFDNLDLVANLLEERSTILAELPRIIEVPAIISDARSEDSLRKTTEANDAPIILDHKAQRRHIEETLKANASRPLWTGVAAPAPEVLPHVYTSALMVQGNVLSQYGSKYTLPIGTTRHDHEDYEEVIIPPAKPVPPRATERLMRVDELDELCKGSFPGYESLNRIQSIVYPTAYGSNENMLVCAPTGAGKTDVAMLTVLRVLDQNRNKECIKPSSLAWTINKGDFKIIYVAPMKALASEITRKLGKRLKWLGINVRELTGDMQMTRQEVSETQIIVTTPEKWDVVTRKPTGEGEIASKVKLLIIDEVHLLNDERGAVLETIVARTLRQVESTQSVIRIVGLSATLPNYVDVAEFLSVSKQTGLFYFDSSFRPVPLEQHFIGIRGKSGSALQRKRLDQTTYHKVEELVNRGHQVMVFVHARKETVKSALALREAALAEGILEHFSCEDHPHWSKFRSDIGQSRNKEMKQLFDNGFGIHHAGMLRSDRNMMERMFEARAIKVLVCTATLAWGVNLPAHAVIIKGTQVYNSSKGSFADLSVLDVLQVFGRAGRPGLEDSGEGYICTTDDKLDHYLNAVTSQNPIESQFTAGMVDALNAEVALGTVASEADAIQWLGYTYLFVRMRKNPSQYGLPREEPADDPQLINKRRQLVTSAARQLQEARMVAYDDQKGTLTITDLGRIAARYYIRVASIEIFHKHFKAEMTEADVLVMLSMSTEFDQIQLRESEIEELERLNEGIPCDVNLKSRAVTSQNSGPSIDNSQAKVNILLQAYISNAYVDDFALVSDMAYVAQNAGRIVRALLEMAISRKWASVSATLMGMSKAIEKRMWPFEQPLKQFPLKAEVLYGLTQYADQYTPAELSQMQAAELGQLIHLNERHGAALLSAAQQFPTARITYRLRPLGFDILRIATGIERAFSWATKLHGSAEPFWIWVEDEEGVFIHQSAYLTFREGSSYLNADFIIQIPLGQVPSSVTIRFVSDRWMGAEEEVRVPLDTLAMPTPFNGHTRRLDLPFLGPSICGYPPLQRALTRRLSSFNAIQTQVAWSLLQTRQHSLLCAPAGSGKSSMSHASILHTLVQVPDTWALLVSPTRSSALEATSDLRRLSADLGISVELIQDTSVFSDVERTTIRVVTAGPLLEAFSRQPPRQLLASLRLVVLENLEELDPTYELAIAELRHASCSTATRFIGVSNSLADPRDVASWLDVDPFALHSFRPRDRDQALSQNIQSFNIPQPAALIKAMAKPAHAAICEASTNDGAIVFVPSRGQCRSIATDLNTQATLKNPTGRGYLTAHVSDNHLEYWKALLQDKTLYDLISRGIGIFHDGIHKADRKLMLDLYIEGHLRVLIIPREACRTVPIRAAVVVVMGTQSIQYDPSTRKRHTTEYSVQDIVRMQGLAVRHNLSGHFYLFCHTESKDAYTRFLEDGIPLESRLLETDHLQKWYRSRKQAGTITDKDQGVKALSWTLLTRRIASNPAYYDIESYSGNDNLSRIIDKLDEASMSAP